MTVTLSPDLELALKEAAQLSGSTPEAIAVQALREKFIPAVPPFAPRDDWERALLAIGTDCGVSLSNEALSSEGFYD